MKKPHYLVLGLACLALLGPLATAVQAQCAMCGTVGQGVDDPLVGGMFKSIVFLMSMPFVVVGTVGGWLFLQLRRGDGLTVPEKPETRLIPFRRDGRE